MPSSARPRNARGLLGIALAFLVLPATAPAATDDYANDDTTTAEFTLDGTNDTLDSISIEGELEYNTDTDWIQLNLEPGGSKQDYLFTMMGENTHPDTYTLYDPYMLLLTGDSKDADNKTIIKEDDDGGPGLDAQILFSVSSSTTVYIEATNPLDYRTGTYGLRLEEVDTDNCPSNTNTGCSIANDETVTETLQFASDSDWFELDSLPGSGKSLRLDLMRPDSGALSNPRLTLYDDNGNYLAQNDDLGPNTKDSRLTYTPSSETTNLYAGADSSADSDTGDYDLTFLIYSDTCASNTNPAADNPSTGCSVAVDDSSNGTIGGDSTLSRGKGDIDWFEVGSLSNSESYQFDVAGITNGSHGDELSDPLLRIYDANGNELAFNDDGQEPDAQLLFTPHNDNSGPYYASVESGPDDTATTPDRIGDFRLEVSTYTEPDCVASTATGCPGTLDGSQVDLIGNSIQSGDTNDSNYPYEITVSGDKDWFAVDLTAGESYRFDLSGLDAGNGALNNPFLRLYDPNGKQVRKNGDSPAKLGFTPKVTDTFYVSVESGDEGGTGGYTLAGDTFGDDHDDCLGSNCSLGSLSVGGSADGNLEVDGDHDWYAVDLESGGDYTFQLKGSASLDKTLDAPFMRILNSKGDVVKSQSTKIDPSGSDAELTFTPGSTDTYYVEAGAYQDQQAQEDATYRVTATLDTTSSDGGLTATSSTSDGGGGGGCTLAGRPQPLDPTLPLLLGLSLAYLAGRRHLR